MILVIAEKNELAQAIEAALEGERRNFKGAVRGKGEYIITFLGGHALTLKDPHEIDDALTAWTYETLPLYFYPWPQRTILEKEPRLKRIEGLLPTCEYVIHAGDVDDEGQLLVDEVLRWFNYTGKVMRLNTSNTTVAGLKKAFAQMTDNKEHERAGWAAYAREVADKTFGFSLSRYFSLLNNAKLSLGRVQTPILGLVVERDLLVENHEKAFYYELFADIGVTSVPGTTLRAKFVPEKDDPHMEDGKILDDAFLKGIGERITTKQYPMAILKEEKQEAPPLPFNLTELQVYCEQQYGYTPKEVMAITQSLRDKHKAITYNRSDCRYLTMEHFAEAPSVIATTMGSLGVDVTGIDATICGKAFNDDHVTLHFAIIPSGQPVRLSNLTQEERNVYVAVASYYLAQFILPCMKLVTKLVVPVEGGHLTASSAEVKSLGYRTLIKKREEEPTGLSALDAGNYDGIILSTDVEKKETKPPVRYTQSALIKDLTRISKYVTDPDAKALLMKKDKDKKGENGSIGTPATRDYIIEGLIRRGFLKVDGKKLISTSIGRDLYAALPDYIKKADMTAYWWAIQEDIINGKAEPTALTEHVLSVIRQVMAECKTPTIITGGREVVAKCPKCGADIFENKNAFSCSNQKCDCVLFKNNKFFASLGRELTVNIAQKLFTKQRVQLRGLKSKSGLRYNAIVKVSFGGRYPQFQIEFENKKTPPPKGGTGTQRRGPINLS